MTDTAITALEQSLQPAWSAFHAHVAQFRASPASREQAELVASYSRDDGFVDSVVDAFSLYLAGGAGFDTKFGSYLDLMLIQRARSEDLAVLQRLAAKHAEDGSIAALMGLMYRLRLYRDDERLTSLIEWCAGALQKFDEPIDNDTWAKSIGIQPTADSWSVSVRLGTAPPHYWLARRDDLHPHDVSLELLVANSREWRIQVSRVDRLYSAQWRPSGITVATEEFRYKSLSAWPAAASHRLFPVFAIRVADYLQVRWTRLAWIASQHVDIDKPQLLEWLYSCADEIRP